MSSAGAQFGRSANLIVASQVETLDLSALRFTFSVQTADTESPNTLRVRVYNLADDTRKRIISEFDSILLQAGYGDNLGLLFRGNIKQFRRGKENNTDSFLDIFAADSDLEYNFGVVNQSFAAGSTAEQQLQAYAGALDLSIDKNANSALTGAVLPRGKVAFGMARTFVRELSRSNSARWSIQEGQIVIIPLDGYLPGEAVKINSLTGLIGVPQATDNGVQFTCLLNPLVKIGTSVELNNTEVTATIVREQFFPSYRSGETLAASTDNDGLYRVLVAEHEGDTRGQQWYTYVTCLHVDRSSNKVLPFG